MLLLCYYLFFSPKGGVFALMQSAVWNKLIGDSCVVRELALPLQKNNHRRMNDEQKLIRTFVVERTD